MTSESDRELGMDRGIRRRDLIGGMVASSLAGGFGLLGNAAPTYAAAQTGIADGSYYPPAATGLRGQHVGSFEAAHAARDGEYEGPIAADDTGEAYDLVVVGGGISGLAAAHFYRRALGNDRKILILDNHDDFGGHAKRNEFTHDGRLYLSYGGTMSIEAPFPYSYTAKALLSDLGIDTSLYSTYLHEEVYSGLGQGTFFGKEQFLSDKLVVPPVNAQTNWVEFFAAAPIDRRLKAELIRVHTEARDFMPGLNPDQKASALKRMSYQDFLLNHAGMPSEALPYFFGMSFRNNMRVDTCPAYSAAKAGAPGFQAMTIGGGPAWPEETTFHFPDGNASIARLLVNRLVPNAFGTVPLTATASLTERVNYAALDLPQNDTRIRLQSIVIRAEHVGEAATADHVRVTYVKNGSRYQVRAKNVIMACFNNILPFIVPDLPETQKTALRYASKVPLIYTSVLVRNWRPWKKLGISSIYSPCTANTYIALNPPVSMGKYHCSINPDEPVVVHLESSPNSPGLPRRDQNRIGRAAILGMSFEDIERDVRSDLKRTLAGGGFDPARDILAITANRWPHGYAYTYDSLGDPDLPEAERPHVIGRQAFGRISIANSDSGAAAYTNVAIDQAHRAVQETLVSLGLI